LPIGAAFGR